MVGTFVRCISASFRSLHASRGAAPVHVIMRCLCRRAWQHVLASARFLWGGVLVPPAPPAFGLAHHSPSLGRAKLPRNYLNSYSWGLNGAVHASDVSIASLATRVGCGCRSLSGRNEYACPVLSPGGGAAMPARPAVPVTALPAGLPLCPASTLAPTGSPTRRWDAHGVFVAFASGPRFRWSFSTNHLSRFAVSLL